MDDTDTIYETSMEIAGKPFDIKIFRRCNGKHFAMTRFSDSDVIVSDGNTFEETLRAHAQCLPLAVDCRWRERSKELGEEPAAHCPGSALAESDSGSCTQCGDIRIEIQD